MVVPIVVVVVVIIVPILIVSVLIIPTVAIILIASMRILSLSAWIRLIDLGLVQFSTRAPLVQHSTDHLPAVVVIAVDISDSFALKALNVIALNSSITFVLVDAIAQLRLVIIVPILLALRTDLIAFSLDTTTLLSPTGTGRGMVEDAFVLYALHGRSPVVVVVSAHVVSLAPANLLPIVLVIAISITRIVADISQRGHRTEQFVTEKINQFLAMGKLSGGRCIA